MNYATKDGSRIMHGANSIETLCGKELDEKWFIHSSAGMDADDITCKKCRLVLQNNKFLDNKG